MVFKLFKNVGLDLVEAFDTSALVVQDVILLTEDYDGVLPIQNPVIHSSQNLKMFLNYHYSGSWKDLFDALWGFDGTARKDLILYLNRQDFCTLVVKFFREVFPTVTDENLKKLYHLTTDRIGTTFGFYYNIGAKAAYAYRTLSVSDLELDLIVKNTQAEGIVTHQMRSALPFEMHFADYKLHGKKSSFFRQYVAVLKQITLDDFRRNVILELKDSLLSRISDFYRFFPNVERKATLMETLNDSAFDFLNDRAVFQHDGSNADEDGNDVLYVLQRYGVDYLKQLSKQVQPYHGTDKKWLESANKFFTEVFIEERARIIQSGEYERLLENQKIAWLNTASIELRHKLRFNFFLLDFFRSISKAELMQFDLSGAAQVHILPVEDDMQIVGVISS